MVYLCQLLVMRNVVFEENFLVKKVEPEEIPVGLVDILLGDRSVVECWLGTGHMEECIPAVGKSIEEGGDKQEWMRS